jgi:hypothetical protein
LEPDAGTENCCFTAKVKRKSNVRVFVFSRSVDLGAACDAVFDFHENPANIPRVSPPGMRLDRVVAAERAREGDVFTIVARLGVVTLPWDGRWERVERPGRLVDTSVSPPFAFWRHSHCFEPIAGGTRMTDRVEYALGGGVAGSVIAATVMPVVFSVMFAWRHHATRKLFGAPAG